MNDQDPKDDWWAWIRGKRASPAEIKRTFWDEPMHERTELTGRQEPPPVSKAPVPIGGMTTSPTPFGSPPDEPVEIVGDVPWEFRDDAQDAAPDGSGS